MTTPAQTPNGGSPLPPVTHGVGNPSGTPVMAPSRTAHNKDGATNSTLGTFGVRITRRVPLAFVLILSAVHRSSPGSHRCSRCVPVPSHNRRACALAHDSDPSHSQGGVIMDVVNAEQVRDLCFHVCKHITHRMRCDLPCPGADRRRGRSAYS